MKDKHLKIPITGGSIRTMTDGVYSKVFARVNVVGDLVIGTGEDTSLVCIRHGRLTLMRQVSDDVVSTSDKRLLVCL